MYSRVYPKDPAIPLASKELANSSGESIISCTGLSIRAELAARAMQGIIASWPTDAAIKYEEIAEESVLMADALIEELNKDEKIL